MKKAYYLFVWWLFFLLLVVSCINNPSLENGTARLTWHQTKKGWQLAGVGMKDSAGNWKSYGLPSGEYTFLYAGEQPPDHADTVILTNMGEPFPGEEYRRRSRIWMEATGPVPMNTAGKAVSFFPSEMQCSGDSFLFRHETNEAALVASWLPDPEYPSDFLVRITLQARKDGWFSIASPTLATLSPDELKWGMVPGYFQGDSLQDDLILAVVYAQGLPTVPYVCKDRTVTTPASILTGRDDMTLSVILQPGQTREPWSLEVDNNTHRQARTGFSHMNRQAQLSPTAYVPLLEHPDARLEAGETLVAAFRYSLGQKGWYGALKHAMDDIYLTTRTLSIRKPIQSLSKRIGRLLDYSLDDQTSFWKEKVFSGKRIGAQSYMGQVVGSDRDAIKNSDIGAMWMMAKITGNNKLNKRRLPLVRNFKLMQQESQDGFFKGAARGQYYLTKSKRWVEEWDSHIEPTGITYYTLADLGNILLFEPGDEELKTIFRAGAERLLEWQLPDGSWVVGYDRQTREAVYTDLRDLRPTFYGLIIAYRILGDKKFLDAALKGADWIIENAVKKGHFLGVCGDVRFINDFATGQISQALLDLWELTGDNRYREAAIETARMYASSIYSHPIPSNEKRVVMGKELELWQYTRAGLSFEHGGSIGSAVGAGPILLASHAGYFARLSQITGDPFFASLARAAAWGRDVFVNPETSVASYYWGQMDTGAGRFPHHAWWQIGWLIDYLVSEAYYRSDGKINFPAGFMTAKVGPHKPYGFEPGLIFGQKAELLFDAGAVNGAPPSLDYLLARETETGHLLIIFLNNQTIPLDITLDLNLDYPGMERATSFEWVDAGGNASKAGFPLQLSIQDVGLKVLRIFAPVETLERQQGFVNSVGRN